MKSYCYFIATSWSDNPISIHFRKLSIRLAERGHKVVILVHPKRPQLENHDANPSIYCWPSNRPTRLSDARFLYALIKKFRPDCLIGNFGAINIMMLVGWFSNVRCRLAWEHTLSTQRATDIGSAWKLYWLRFLQFRRRYVYKAATHNVVNSAATAEDVQCIFGVPSHKCQIFYYSIEDPLENLDLSRVVKRKNLLVCVGRLHLSKGQDTLIRAAALLKLSIPDIRVEFVGSGPSRNSYLKLVHELGVDSQCTFLGNVSHEEVLMKMAEATATVVPSRSEAFGIVNVESLAVSTPVIASSVGGIVEIIRDNLDGLLFPPNDSHTLAEKVRRILLDDQLQRTIMKNGRERFLNLFEPSKIIGEQVEWLENIISVPIGNLTNNKKS